jgi:hypothetical protein
MKGNILVVNDLLTVNSVDYRNEIEKAILQSDALTDKEKAQELYFLSNAMPASDVLDLSYIRENFDKTKFLHLYAYLVEKLPEANLLNINALPAVLAPVTAAILPRALGSTTECGVLGSIFNTKACKEKRQLASQLAQTQPAQTIQRIVQQPIETFMPESSTTSKSTSSSDGGLLNQKIAGIPAILIIAAVVLFLFMKKRKR